jgi:hypothetical protein
VGRPISRPSFGRDTPSMCRRRHAELASRIPPRAGSQARPIDGSEGPSLPRPATERDPAPAPRRCRCGVRSGPSSTSFGRVFLCRQMASFPSGAWTTGTYLLAAVDRTTPAPWARSAVAAEKLRHGQGRLTRSSPIRRQNRVEIDRRIGGFRLDRRADEMCGHERRTLHSGSVEVRSSRPRP